MENGLFVIAVVVTYNRLPLLRRNIACLRANAPVSRIIVVDNGSTDGTAEWLESERDERLCTVRQENVGGSGGFHRGIDEAVKAGADWVWCMDDDVFPRADCLQQMLPYTADERVGLIAPRRLMAGRVFTNDFTGYDFTHPFRSLYTGKLAKLATLPSEPTPIAGTAFEGPLIRAEAVKKAGLPNRDLFIFCDDTDYCIRLGQAGYRLLSVPAAMMDKEKFFSDDTWAERNRKKKWKRFYQVRNSTYLNHHYGRNVFVRYGRGLLCVLGYIVPALVTFPFSKAWQLGDVAKLWRAYLDGVSERLGRIS